MALATMLGSVACALLPDGRIPVVFFERLLCVCAGGLAFGAVVVIVPWPTARTRNT